MRYVHIVLPVLQECNYYLERAVIMYTVFWGPTIQDFCARQCSAAQQVCTHQTRTTHDMLITNFLTLLQPVQRSSVNEDSHLLTQYCHHFVINQDDNVFTFHSCTRGTGLCPQSTDPTHFFPNSCRRPCCFW